MKFGSYIHGTPEGFEYSGIEKEKDYFFKNYYNKRRGIDEFRIEARTIGEEKFYYYSYIIGENVLNCDGRSGAYFGITVRLDCYYKKALNLYYLLDSYFHSYLYGKLFEQNGKTLIYKNTTINTSFFEEKEALRGLIEKSFSGKDLVTLNCTKSNDYAKISLADADDDKVMNDLERYGEVSISKEYPSNAVSNCIKEKDEEISQIKKDKDSKIQAINKEKEDSINQLRAKYANIDNKIQELNKELNVKQKELNNTKDELNYKKNLLTQKTEELSNLKDEFEQTSRGIIDQIRSLVNNANYKGKGKHKNHHQAPTQSDVNLGCDNKENVQKSNDLVPKDKIQGFANIIKTSTSLIIPFVNTVLLLIIFLVLLPSACSDKSITKQDLEECLKTFKTEISPKKINKTSVSENEGAKNENTNKQNVRIDVKEFRSSEDVMNIEDIYHIKVIGYDENKGYWDWEPKDGLEISVENDVASMWANKAGEYEIKFKVGDETIVEREIKVKVKD